MDLVGSAEETYGDGHCDEFDGVEMCGCGRRCGLKKVEGSHDYYPKKE